MVNHGTRTFAAAKIVGIVLVFAVISMLPILFADAIVLSIVAISIVMLFYSARCALQDFRAKRFTHGFFHALIVVPAIWLAGLYLLEIHSMPTLLTSGGVYDRALSALARIGKVEFALVALFGVVTVALLIWTFVRRARA